VVRVAPGLVSAPVFPWTAPVLSPLSSIPHLHRAADRAAQEYRNQPGVSMRTCTAKLSLRFAKGAVDRAGERWTPSLRHIVSSAAINCGGAFGQITMYDYDCMLTGEHSEGALMTNQPYDQKFYDDMTRQSVESARIFLQHLFSIWRPRSVIDIGCGQGAWLSVADEFLVDHLIGVDGEWVDEGKLLSPKIDFRSGDLNAPIDIAEFFDLAFSPEVAGHLNPQSSEMFLSSLSRLSGAVFFSAAFTAQPGTNHINTRRHSFWAQVFKSQGFDAFDIFRSMFWNDERVAPCYRQNTFLYVRADLP
jgi:SAM-dependent methyltransferase